ncbi:MAG: hypothetical protein HQM16_01165 [Deltaproteobacteria bacterium]|nr:hypothetical protein [Deltaproteobacteria bacterium]
MCAEVYIAKDGLIIEHEDDLSDIKGTPPPQLDYTGSRVALCDQSPSVLDVGAIQQRAAALTRKTNAPTARTIHGLVDQYASLLTKKNVDERQRYQATDELFFAMDQTLIETTLGNSENAWATCTEETAQALCHLVYETLSRLKGAASSAWSEQASELLGSLNFAQLLSHKVLARWAAFSLRTDCNTSRKEPLLDVLFRDLLAIIEIQEEHAVIDHEQETNIKNAFITCSVTYKSCLTETCLTQVVKTAEKEKIPEQKLSEHLFGSPPGDIIQYYLETAPQNDAYRFCQLNLWALVKNGHPYARSMIRDLLDTQPTTPRPKRDWRAIYSEKYIPIFFRDVLKKLLLPDTDPENQGNNPARCPDHESFVSEIRHQLAEVMHDHSEYSGALVHTLLNLDNNSGDESVAIALVQGLHEEWVLKDKRKRSYCEPRFVNLAHYYQSYQFKIECTGEYPDESSYGVYQQRLIQGVSLLAALVKNGFPGTLETLKEQINSDSALTMPAFSAIVLMFTEAEDVINPSAPPDTNTDTEGQKPDYRETLNKKSEQETAQTLHDSIITFFNKELDINLLCRYRGHSADDTNLSASHTTLLQTLCSFFEDWGNKNELWRTYLAIERFCSLNRNSRDFPIAIEVIGVADRRDQYHGRPLSLLTDVVLFPPLQNTCSDIAFEYIGTNLKAAGENNPAAFQSHLNALVRIAEDRSPTNRHRMAAVAVLTEAAEKNPRIAQRLKGLNIDGLLSEIDTDETYVVHALCGLAEYGNHQAFNYLERAFINGDASLFYNFVNILHAHVPSFHERILRNCKQILSNSERYSIDMTDTTLQILGTASGLNIKGSWAVLYDLVTTSPEHEWYVSYCILLDHNEKGQNYSEREHIRWLYDQRLAAKINQGTDDVAPYINNAGELAGLGYTGSLRALTKKIKTAQGQKGQTPPATTTKDRETAENVNDARSDNEPAPMPPGEAPAASTVTTYNVLPFSEQVILTQLDHYFQTVLTNDPQVSQVHREWAIDRIKALALVLPEPALDALAAIAETSGDAVIINKAVDAMIERAQREGSTGLLIEMQELALTDPTLRGIAMQNLHAYRSLFRETLVYYVEQWSINAEQYNDQRSFNILKMIAASNLDEAIKSRADEAVWLIDANKGHPLHSED